MRLIVIVLFMPFNLSLRLSIVVGKPLLSAVGLDKKTDEEPERSKALASGTTYHLSRALDGSFGTSQA